MLSIRLKYVMSSLAMRRITFFTVFSWIWLKEYPDFLLDFARYGRLSRETGCCWEFIGLGVGPLLLMFDTNIESLLSFLGVDACLACRLFGF